MKQVELTTLVAADAFAVMCACGDDVTQTKVGGGGSAGTGGAADTSGIGIGGTAIGGTSAIGGSGGLPKTPSVDAG